MRRPLCTILLLCSLLVTGCKTYHSVTIGVSTNDGDAVQGATVQAAPMYFFNPSNERYIFVIGAYDILDPFPATGDAGVTDNEGLVTLEIVDDSPLMLNVFAEGYRPWRGQIALSKQDEMLISSYVSDPELVISLPVSEQSPSE